MKLQLSLTVSEAKRVIAKGIKQLPEIQRALREGRILLKGGTTVSAFAEEAAGVKLGICGRVTPKGTKGGKYDLDAPHCILIEGGMVKDVDDAQLFEEAAMSLKKGDILITGANAFDIEGNAAMMAGSPLGNFPGKIIPALCSEGVRIIIAAGLEKLIPGKIDEAVEAAGRKNVDISLGMAVGLIPIKGSIIDERKALEILAGVKATVIGMGGIMGAEGATTMIVEGPQNEVEKIFNIIKSIKGSGVSGSPRSLVECERGSPGCREDMACAYRAGLT
ncbi:hypothetical protein H0A61_00930 [Koleobacter methoxysyntrophicus]|jgi:hypothetical protein|uniref:Uncharacterized protein n=1 Tax=Koleobacter methoxysyntrophicus TaxID=2751313 RepID=A0A8A0RMA9_9FIRM|nr:hypothetical protein [Koleobacter methoxysyntrophicus]QSQ08597.1 hypothetical protein H0A61_00930 [Koleobacter methoxysyntrophicus]